MHKSNYLKNQKVHKKYHKLNQMIVNNNNKIYLKFKVIRKKMLLNHNKFQKILIKIIILNNNIILKQ